MRSGRRDHRAGGRRQGDRGLRGGSAALLLLVVGVVGAQIGARLSAKVKGEHLRVMLALIVLAVAIRLALDLVITPSELFSLGGGDGS